MAVPSIILSGSALHGVAPHLLSAGLLAGLPQAVKLGRLRPRARPQALRLATYLPADGAATAPPAVVDYAAKAKSALARMYLNDRLGCCVISDCYHSIGVWSGNDAGTALEGTDSEVLATYRIWNPGNQDNGCVITDVLDYCRDHGIPVNGIKHRIGGYVAADWRNKLEIQVALYLFGNVRLGINLPEAWTRAAVWDVTNTPIVGGHDVPLVGYNEQGVQVASWARIYTITWAAFTSPRWVEEAYPVLSPDWYNDDKLAPNGLNVATLQADLIKIGAGTIPPIDPDPIPAPPPVPVPPPPAPVPPPVPAALGSVYVDPTNKKIYYGDGWTPKYVPSPGPPSPVPHNGANSVYPYPTDFPSSELASLMGYLHGSPPPLADLLHDLWSLAGYSLARFAPELKAVAPVGAVIYNGVLLEQMATQLSQQRTATAGLLAFDWSGFLKQILVLISGLL